MKNQTRRSISAAAIALSFAACGAAQAHDATRSCVESTLRGLYVLSASGFNIAGGVAVPKAIVESIRFNGDGSLHSPAATVSINGNILHFADAPGSYTVETNCTGTLTFPGVATWDLFIAPSGSEIFMIQTGPTSTPPGSPVFQGIARRVSR